MRRANLQLYLEMPCEYVGELAVKLGVLVLQGGDLRLKPASARARPAGLALQLSGDRTLQVSRLGLSLALLPDQQRP